jgi:hypothetical protein
VHDLLVPTSRTDLLHRGSNEGISGNMTVRLLEVGSQWRIETILITHDPAP